MANKEKQKDLLIQLRNLFDQLCEEASDDDFNSLLSNLGIFKISLDDASRELTNVIENTFNRTGRLKVANDNRTEIYNQVIKTLMSNDNNGAWDEILQEDDNDLDHAIYLVKEALERIIDEEGYEGEELDFYKNQLNKIIEINTI
jgi:gamma-glutamylcysteine synthetase